MGIMKTENNSDTIWLIKETNFTCIAFCLFVYFFEFLNDMAQASDFNDGIFFIFCGFCQ